MGCDVIEEDTITQQWREMYVAIQQISEIAFERFEVLYERVRGFCDAFHRILWDAYVEAGMPYGETDDGMWRWAHECVKIERLRREADEMELYHQHMASFRRIVLERKFQHQNNNG